MLDVADVAGYLLERGLLSPRAVVDGGLRVVDASRLNRVFLVTAEREPSYVVKLAGRAGDAGVAHEAAVLGRLRALDSDGDGVLASRLPAVVAYDPVECILVLEAAAGARDLVRHHRQGRFSVALAREAGRALGSLHRVAPAALDGLGTFVELASRRGVHRPDLEVVHTSSATALELIALVQRSEELCARLDELEGARRVESAIHGDVRWDNCLAVPGGSGRWGRLLLIDWELAGPGDPAEDVGAFLGEYLGAWLRSMPDLEPHERSAAPAGAGQALEHMWPAVRGFWEAYARHRGRPAAELGPTLRRAAQFAAARLVTAAFEEAQLLPHLRASVLNAVQMGHAVLRRPDEAATQLLGLSTRRAVA